MKHFLKIKARVKDHDLMIEEVPYLLGFHFSRKESGTRYYHIDSKSTLASCKELALAMYDAPLNGWHSSGGEYLQSLIATHSGNKPGYTFRIAETKIENGHLFGEAAYLYGFDENAYQKYDYGQNSIEICKEFALREFDVPLDAWREEE